jgi:hypothetical protein
LSETSTPSGFKKDGTPQKRANQWTKARDQARLAIDAEEHRRRIKVGMLQARLHSAAMGKADMSATQVAAAKVLLDKAMPTLQAVEQSYTEPAATRSEAELLAELKAVLASNPDLAQKALAELAKESGEQPKVA